ncbi:hypothetical protein APHAL10511_006933 [Amanita phalloides]|nr:hypothetical protein APHAL10511_006933 [Amanita phalloides]
MVVPRKRKHSHNDLHAPLSSNDTGSKGENQSQDEERRCSMRLRGRGTTIGPTDDTRNKLLEGAAPDSDCNGGKEPQSKKHGCSMPTPETDSIPGTSDNTPRKCLKFVEPNFDHEGEEGPQSKKHSHSMPARRRGTITGKANNTWSQQLKCVVPPSSKVNKAKTAERDSPACSDLIQEFFKLTLHRRADDKDSNERASTRGPAPYDMHLKDDLRLKKVFYCSNLVSQLGDIVEHSIRKYQASPRATPVESMFDLEHIRAKLKLRLLHHDMTEHQVIEAYGSTIAKNIMPIVSAITMLQQLSGVVSWTSHIKHGCAIADAALVHSIMARWCFCQNSEDSKQQPISQSPSECFPHPLLFEFKNPRAGSHRHMVSMLEAMLHDVFPWQGCNEERCSLDCGKK